MNRQTHIALLNLRDELRKLAKRTDDHHTRIKTDLLDDVFVYAEHDVEE